MQTPTERTRVLCVDDIEEVNLATRLLIDSDPTMTCVGCLESADHLVEEVRNRRPRPDVVVLDGRMPGSDSMDVTRELSTAFPSTRVIIFSGRDDSEFLRRAREAGAWGCVCKDEDPEALVRAVRDVAAGRTSWRGGGTFL
jgi:DNA-binding NarL/FixJ family response regulator